MAKIWFSTKYKTYRQWLKAQPDKNAPEVKKVKEYHKKNKKATLNEARKKGTMPVNLNKRIKDWNKATQNDIDQHKFQVDVLNEMRYKQATFDEAYKTIKKTNFGMDVPTRTSTREALSPYLERSTIKKNNRTVKQYVPKKKDTILRRNTIIINGTPEVVLTRGNDMSTLIGEYWQAVKKGIRYGVWNDLDTFLNVYVVTADGRKILLETDENILINLANRGEIADIVVSG